MKELIHILPMLCVCCCSHVYHIVRPSRAPGFAYSWLELISHRIFIAKLLLQTPQQKVATVIIMYSLLLVVYRLLKYEYYFMEPLFGDDIESIPRQTIFSILGVAPVSSVVD